MKQLLTEIKEYLEHLEFDTVSEVNKNEQMIIKIMKMMEDENDKH